MSKYITCYVLKSVLKKRYLKLRYGDYILTTPNVLEAKLLETYNSAEIEQPRNSLYAVKELEFCIDGSNDIEGTIRLEHYVEKYTIHEKSIIKEN